MWFPFFIIILKKHCDQSHLLPLWSFKQQCLPGLYVVTHTWPMHRTLQSLQKAMETVQAAPSLPSGQQASIPRDERVDGRIKAAQEHFPRTWGCVKAHPGNPGVSYPMCATNIRSAGPTQLHAIVSLTEHEQQTPQSQPVNETQLFKPPEGKAVSPRCFSKRWHLLQYGPSCLPHPYLMRSRDFEIRNHFPPVFSQHAIPAFRPMLQTPGDESWEMRILIFQARVFASGHLPLLPQSTLGEFLETSFKGQMFKLNFLKLTFP